MVYGYARCSTNIDKQDIDRQKRELRKMGVTDNVNIYWEYESGTKADRPELTKLMNIVQAGDTIVTTEISRITRSTKQLCDIIEFVKERHLKLVIKNSVTLDCTDGKNIDPMTRAFLEMAGVFAELERNMISERVKSGMANAKAKGKKIGRQKVTIDTIPKSVIDKYEAYKNGYLTKKEYAEVCRISRPTLDKYLKIYSKKGDKASK